MVATRRKEEYTLLGGGEWMRLDAVGDGISHCPCSREYEEGNRPEKHGSGEIMSSNALHQIATGRVNNNNVC